RRSRGPGRRLPGVEQKPPPRKLVAALRRGGNEPRWGGDGPRRRDGREPHRLGGDGPRRRDGTSRGSAPEQPREEPGAGRLALVSVTALGAGHIAHDPIHVLAAAGPGGLAAGAAGHRSAHVEPPSGQGWQGRQGCGAAAVIGPPRWWRR